VVPALDAEAGVALLCLVRGEEGEGVVVAEGVVAENEEKGVCPFAGMERVLLHHQARLPRPLSGDDVEGMHAAYHSLQCHPLLASCFAHEHFSQELCVVKVHCSLLLARR
jgi:hypothetical protein